MSDAVQENPTMFAFRTRSRFEPSYSARYRGCEEVFSHKAYYGHWLCDTMISISPDAISHGVTKNLRVSAELYRKWIRAEDGQTRQRIATLCHALLYHADLEQYDNPVLRFEVPFFTECEGYTPVKVQAQIGTGADSFIFVELDK